MAIAGSNCYHFGFLNTNKMKEDELLVIYVTKDQKEIHRDFNPKFIPVETNLISFKRVESPNIFGELKEKLMYVANVEFQVPDVVIITLFHQAE